MCGLKKASDRRPQRRERFEAFLCRDTDASDRPIPGGLHFALSGMYKIQEIEVSDFQE